MGKNLKRDLPDINQVVSRFLDRNKPVRLIENYNKKSAQA